MALGTIMAETGATDVFAGTIAALGAGTVLCELDDISGTVALLAGTFTFFATVAVGAADFAGCGATSAAVEDFAGAGALAGAGCAAATGFAFATGRGAGLAGALSLSSSGGRSGNTLSGT